MNKEKLARALFVSNMAYGTGSVLSVEKAAALWDASVKRDLESTLRIEYVAFAEHVLAVAGAE